MILKVMAPEGHVVMQTEHVPCFPNADDLRHMAKAGFRFLLDEKPATVKKLLPICEKAEPGSAIQKNSRFSKTNMIK